MKHVKLSRKTQCWSLVFHFSSSSTSQWLASGESVSRLIVCLPFSSTLTYFILYIQMTLIQGTPSWDVSGYDNPPQWAQAMREMVKVPSEPSMLQTSATALKVAKVLSWLKVITGHWSQELSKPGCRGVAVGGKMGLITQGPNGKVGPQEPWNKKFDFVCSFYLFII